MNADTQFTACIDGLAAGAEVARNLVVVMKTVVEDPGVEKLDAIRRVLTAREYFERTVRQLKEVERSLKQRG